MAVIGRLPETTKGYFVEAKPEKTMLGHAAGLEKRDRREWVDCDNSQLPKALIRYWRNHIGIGGGFATVIGGCFQ